MPNQVLQLYAHLHSTPLNFNYYFFSLLLPRHLCRHPLALPSSSSTMCCTTSCSLQTLGFHSCCIKARDPPSCSQLHASLSLYASDQALLLLLKSTHHTNGSVHTPISRLQFPFDCHLSHSQYVISIPHLHITWNLLEESNTSN
jgi:hypothetical protein